MEKIKFGIQLIVLMLAFPVFFITEMKQADKDMKKNQLEKQELIDAKTTKTSEMMKRSIVFSNLPYWLILN